MPKNFFNEGELFKYELDYSEISHDDFSPGPAPPHDREDPGFQAKKEWDRNLERYYINGKSVKQILLALRGTNLVEFDQLVEVTTSLDKERRVKETLKFKNEDALRVFFRNYLLYKIKDPKIKEAMCDLALDHFHQSGLPHVMSSVFSQQLQKYESETSGIQRIAHPEINVHFTPLANGVRIKESNQYNHLQDMLGTTEHEEKLTDKRYFIKLEARSSLTVSRVGDQLRKRITLHNVSANVNGTRFHPLFNKVNFLEWFKEKIVLLFKDRVVRESEYKENQQTRFQDSK